MRLLAGEHGLAHDLCHLFGVLVGGVILVGREDFRIFAATYSVLVALIDKGNIQRGGIEAGLLNKLTVLWPIDIDKAGLPTRRESARKVELAGRCKPTTVATDIAIHANFPFTAIPLDDGVGNTRNMHGALVCAVGVVNEKI